jgi:hypothetical protein
MLALARAEQRQPGALAALQQYVDEVEAELGRPIDPGLMAEAERAWHNERD